ncbi:MAG: response regulator transcription factor [Clostridia bacterium]|nr:response regulator transcription factor [Clostridia bacterium]
MIQCIAIDDEPLALKQLAAYISKTPFLELAGQFESAMPALAFLQEETVDLMFVDINMPDLSGMEFVKSLDNPPGIIFTTAYSEHALEGFRVDAIDYLLKPISYTDFLKAANKANKMLSIGETSQTVVKAKEDFLLIKSEHRVIRVNFNDILYIEGMREYVRIHLASQKPVMSLLSMKALEAQLPGSQFMRVHRSFIVSLNRITTIERMRIVFDDDVYIPVSEQYQKPFREWMERYFM